MATRTGEGTEVLQDILKEKVEAEKAYNKLSKQIDTLTDNLSKRNISEAQRNRLEDKLYEKQEQQLKVKNRLVNLDQEYNKEQKKGIASSKRLRLSQDKLTKANNAASRSPRGGQRGGPSSSAPSNLLGGGRSTPPISGGPIKGKGASALGSAAAAGYSSGGAAGAIDAIADQMIAAGAAEAGISVAAALATGGAALPAAAPGAAAAAAGLALKAAAKGASGAINLIADQVDRFSKISELASLRFRQFGSSIYKSQDKALRSVDYAEDYRKEVSALSNVFNKSVFSGIKYGLEPDQIEQLKSSMAEIGYVTGESYEDGIGNFFGEKGIIQEIARMATSGYGEIDDLTKKYVKAVKQYGMSSERALESIRSVAEEARSLSLYGSILGDNKKNVVLMEDFVADVEHARDAVESLVATEEGLAKTLKLGLAISQKTLLTYEQRRKGARELSKGMTGQYSQQWATVAAPRDVGVLTKQYTQQLQDLQAAGASPEKLQEVEAKLETLKFIGSKGLTPDVQARMLSEGGFDQDLFAVRLKDAVMTGNYHLMQSMQENPLSLEQYRIMDMISQEIKGGAKPEDVIAKYMQTMIGGTAAARGSLAIPETAAQTQLGREEEIRKSRVGLKSIDTLKYYGEEALKTTVTSVNAASVAVNKWSSTVTSATDALLAMSSTTFPNLASAVADATNRIQSLAATPTTAVVPTGPLPSSVTASGTYVNPNGDIIIPARILAQAMGVTASRAASTGTTP